MRMVRPNPVQPSEQWAMDFIHDTLAGGEGIRVLTAIDLCTRECVAMNADLPESGVVPIAMALLRKRRFDRTFNFCRGVRF